MTTLRSEHFIYLLSSLMVTTLVACNESGQVRYSPDFENRMKLQEKNVCSSYPIGFSRIPSAATEALQTPLERRTTVFLRQFVTDRGLVRYSALTSSSDDLQELADLVKGFSSQLSPSVPFESQQKAIWINLYNLATLQLITSNYSRLLGDESSPFPEIKSIQNIQGLGSDIWNVKDIATSRGNLSLNEIEAEIRKAKDPRFHFAINCASLGCPPLLDTAYVGLALDSQLNERTCAYVNSGEFSIFDDLDPDAPVVFTSQIFKWYESDFGNLFDFLNEYLSDRTRLVAGHLNLKRSDGENVWAFEFEDYSWELNEEFTQ